MIEGLGIALGRLASPPPPGVPQAMGAPGGPMSGAKEDGPPMRYQIALQPANWLAVCLSCH